MIHQKVVYPKPTAEKFPQQYCWGAFFYGIYLDKHLNKKMFMKKLIIVLAVGMIASNGMAQSGKKTVPPPPPPVPPAVEAPAPPPPPAPPQDLQFAPPKIVKDAPPPPRLPKAAVTKVKFAPPAVNDKGYAMLIRQTNNEDPVILLTKKGITQKIRMSVWNAKPEYFENKYGKLPPPPPPPPAPPIKE
jgi:hypothetical protein